MSRILVYACWQVSYMFPEPSKDRQLLQVSLLTQRGPVSIGSTALGVASPLKLHIVRAPGPAQASYCSAEGSGWNMLTAGAPGDCTFSAPSEACYNNPALHGQVMASMQ